MANVFVQFTLMRNGATVRVNASDVAISSLSAVPPSTLPSGVVAATRIEWDTGRALFVQGTVADTITALQGGLSTLNPTFIPDPGPAHGASTTALAIYNAQEPVGQWTPTVANLKLDPRDAPYSMAFTVMKTNAMPFGIVLDVTTGGNQGWTTPGGLNTDYTLFNSAAAAAGSWLVRIDKPNKTVLATPVN